MRLTKEEIVAAWDEAVPESKDKGIEMYLHLMQAVADAQYRKCSQESVRSEALMCVLEELRRATVKFPTWPTDPLHALAVLGEEFGELTKAMLQVVYEPYKASREEVRKEAMQTAAMALRLCASLDIYEYEPGLQHEQTALQSPARVAWGGSQATRSPYDANGLKEYPGD